MAQTRQQRKKTLSLKKKANKKTAVLLATASFVFAILVLTSWIVLKIFNEQKEQQSLARISAVEGDVIVFQSQRRVKAHLGLPIYKFDRLHTAADSRVTLNFISGDQIQFDENTEANFRFWDNQKQDWPIFVHIRRGKFDHLKAGEANKLVVEYQEGLNTTIQSAPVLSQNGLRLEVEPQDPEKSMIAGTNLRPTNQDIILMVKNYMDQLQKCQLNAFGSEQVAKGQLVLSFSILPAGRTKDINIVESSTHSDQLDVCVKSVFERIRFPQFEGQTIDVTFPLKFE